MNLSSSVGPFSVSWPLHFCHLLSLIPTSGDGSESITLYKGLTQQVILSSLWSGGRKRMEACEKYVLHSPGLLLI